jgi:aspartate aminotransferase-like enzyme
LLNKHVFTPGPTQVPPTVLNAVTGSTAYHRSQEFKDFHLRLISKLKSIFFTNQNLNILTTSGTGAMEAAVVNFCCPGETILFINQGRFGSRWGSICTAYGINARELLITPGKAVNTDELTRIDLNDIKAVFFTHTETSTATLTDIKELSDYVKNNSDALVIVDSVTSVGAIEFKMDDWRVDVAVSASQKGLMTPPGLSMIAYSEKAKEKMYNNPMSRFYLDLRKEVKSQMEGLTEWTPAIGLMYGLDKASDVVLDYGIEKWWAKTASCASFVRKEGEAIGFKVFSKSPSDSLTAFSMPDNIPSGILLNNLKSKYAIQIANGQAELKNKIFRISHMGDLYLDDFKELLKIIKKEYSLLRNSN